MSPHPNKVLIHLDSVVSSNCNPKDNLSCGACCGVYDFLDDSKENIEMILRHRTDIFDEMVRNGKEDIWSRLEYASRHLLLDEQGFKSKYAQNGLVPRPCVFLGFVSQEPIQVGCLLHPSQNNGQDFRYYGSYPQCLCASYVCNHPEVKDLSKSCNNWYEYGMLMSMLEGSQLVQRKT